MILSDVVKIKISNNQISYYKNKGYNFAGGNKIEEVKISDLPSNSGQKIKVKCDFCGKEKEISLNRYNINCDSGAKKYACSRKCSEQKNKDSILKKYNVENISQSNDIKNKKINTCRKNFGVDFPQQSNLIFEKSLNKKNLLYGDKFYNNSKQMINTKSLNVCEKYKAKVYKDGIFTFYCNDCQNEYEISLSLFHNRKRIKTKICTNCNPFNSNESPNEVEVLNFIRENYDAEIKVKDRNILNGKELDIFLPDLKLAFEYNGIYWHSELYKPTKYHKDKTEICKKNNISLFHIWEDDWKYKQDIIKSMILNKLNKTKYKIYARKTEIKIINDRELVKSFLENNHLQGYINSKINIGLFQNNELYSIMTFSRNRRSSNKSGEWELLRFCNKINYNIIGSASKLLKFFIQNFKDNKIITFADLSFSSGELYFKLGFNLDGITQPNYFYIIDGIRKHRFNFRKNELVKKGYDISKSEHQIMLDRNIYRIYDSGNMRFILD